MTPARKAALQWFHDRGEVALFRAAEFPPSQAIMKRMIKDGHLQAVSPSRVGLVKYSLTDKGRRALHGDHT